MKYISKLFFSLSVAACSILCSHAADFFSTEKPDETFNIGVHFGINTSNRTLAKDVFKEWNSNSWGTGIDAGATVDINFRDWISIQPGFFYESRSGNYAYAYSAVDADNELVQITQFGHGRSYNFTIPILAAVHLNVSDDVRWNCELGPYLQFSLKNTFSDKAIYPTQIISEGHLLAGVATAKTKAFDFGFKMGTGLTIRQHYNFGIHYLAGCLKAWKPAELGGRNKEWVFSVGYIF
ncbi:MAG: PorT family protein [Muribaculum sp.]|nr:PorT family protein [Muribaculum sp.]